ncbi:hypothetical protein AAC387_Pa04g2742 [Persea americana]
MDGGDGRDDEVGITNASGIKQEFKLLQLEPFEGFLPDEWTDEKHNLYLNSIEASFVKQLYNPDNLLRDLHVWSSRRQKYKVLRKGCWEKINCERTQTRPNYGNESCLLLKNQFIQHSCPASVAKDLKLKMTARDIPQHGKLFSDVVHFGGQKYRRTVFGLGTSSKQQSRCYPAICRQDSVGSNTEVSDQNFVEEDFDSTSLSRSRKKRRRVTAAGVSSRDQVVPLVKSPVTASANGRYFQKEDEHCSDEQAKNMTCSPLPKYGPPSSEDREKREYLSPIQLLARGMVQVRMRLCWD